MTGKYLKLITDKQTERAARELIQQFEPEGRADGADDSAVLETGVDGGILSIRITDPENPDKSIVVETPLDPDAEETVLNQEQQIKRALYDVLSEYHGRTLPWGILTGVKPVRFYKKTKEHFPDQDTEKILTESCRISHDNAALAAEISRIQEPVLEQRKARSLSLYVGIPVCPAKCSYCSFVSTILDKKRKLLTDYLPLLEREIQETGRLFNDAGARVDSVYIGGGTPSVLTAAEADRLLGVLSDSFDLSELKEFSFEAGRADTTTPELLKVLADHSVSRVCLNPQSMNASTLTAVNRLFTPDDIRRVYGEIREAGDFDINMDLILGLNHEDETDFMYSLEELFRMAPENITVHDLAVKKGTRIKNERGTGDHSRYNPRFFEEIRDRLREKGYLPYYLYRQKYTIGNGENTGWCRPGHESFYNIMMMAEEQTILGIGAGSSGKLYCAEDDRFSRVFTVKDLRTYNARPAELLDKKMKAYREFLDSGEFEK